MPRAVHHELDYSSQAFDQHPVRKDRLLRLPQVQEIVALGKTMIYRLVSEGRFPQPLKLCGRATRWSEAEVYAWLATQSASRH